MGDDLFKELPGNIDFEILNAIREERALWLERDSVEKYLNAVNSILPRKVNCDFAGPEIIIGNENNLKGVEKRKLIPFLETFMPWRKGPFRILGEKIDAEWKSNLKFDRILPHLDDPKDKVIADVGANNGYYMFRLAHYNPAAVIAFEPTVHYKILFDFLNGLAGLKNLQFELLGGEHLIHFQRTFDTVLCLGVLYHHRDPLGMLKGIWESLKPDGQVIIESQGIPGEGSYCLFPEKRYGKVPGTWFIPTEKALLNWIKRCGFKEVELFYKHPMSSKEQRKTRWMQYESYKDYLDPKDPQKTIEGYPAPWRFYVKARKKLG